MSWSGAHPTGGIVADQNSIDAQHEEYPFVLLECRGVDSTKVQAVQAGESRDLLDAGLRASATRTPTRRPSRRTASIAMPRRPIGPGWSAAATAARGVPVLRRRADAALGAVHRRRRARLPRGTGRMRGPAAGVAVGRRVRAAEQRDLRRHRPRRQGHRELRHLDLGGERLARAAPSSWPARSLRFRSWGSAATPARRVSRLLTGRRPARWPRPHAQCETKGALRARPAHADRRAATELAVSGSLWWSASNWRNRITVPLSFAVPDNACDVVSSSNDVDIYGSELLIQATGQWAPHFCLNPKLFKFTHVQTGEPEARNLLATGSAEAAFISDPPPGGYPQTGGERAGCGERLRDHLRDRRRERPAVHQAAAHSAAARQAADRVLPGGVAGPGGGSGARAQPAGHHPRPGVPEAQPRYRARRQCHRVRGDAAGVVQRLRRHRGADHLHQRQPGGARVAQRQARPVGHGGQPGVQGDQAAGQTSGRCCPPSSRRRTTPRTTTTACTTARCPSCRSSPRRWPAWRRSAEAMQFSVAQSTTVCSQIDGTTARREAGRRSAGRRSASGS